MKNPTCLRACFSDALPVAAFEEIRHPVNTMENVLSAVTSNGHFHVSSFHE